MCSSSWYSFACSSNWYGWCFKPIGSSDVVGEDCSLESLLPMGIGGTFPSMVFSCHGGKFGEGEDSGFSGFWQGRASCRLQSPKRGIGDGVACSQEFYLLIGCRG